MPLPATFDTITLTGTYLTLTGLPATGSVTFSAPPEAWLHHLATDVQVVPATFTVSLNSGGSFSVVLPVTDDPDVVPSFVYNVVVTITGPAAPLTRSFAVEIPVDLLPGPVDLADLAPTGVVVTGTTALTRTVADALYEPLGGGGGGVSSWNDLQDKPATFPPTIGTTSSTAVAGNDARLTDQRVPTDSSVTNAKVAAGAAVSLDKTADSATRLAMTSAERTKLTGVAAGATANSTDAVLLARANHTGTQPQSTVTNLAADLSAKAPLASPTFTGSVTVPTATADGHAVNRGQVSSMQGTFTRVVKGTDTSRASNVTPAADPELTIAVPSSAIGKRCRVYLEAWTSGIANVGTKSSLTLPTNSFMRCKAVGVTPAGASTAGTTVRQGDIVVTGRTTTSEHNHAALPLVGGTAATLVTWEVDFTPTAAGSVTFLWSQHTSNATATIVHAGSDLELYVEGT